MMSSNLPQMIGPLWGMSELCLGLVKRSRANATSKDRHSLAVIWLVYLFAIPLAIVAAYHLPECRIRWPQWIGALGAGLFVLGLILRLSSIIHLGRFFTVNVAIAADHRFGGYRSLSFCASSELYRGPCWRLWFCFEFPKLGFALDSLHTLLRCYGLAH